MKRTFIAALVIATLASLPAHAKVRTVATKSITFKAVTPCAVACSYYVSPDDPEQAVNAQLNGGDDFDKQTSYACTKPGPAGSYRDVVLTVPRGVNYMKVVATPEVDWDLVLCEKPKSGNNGRMVKFESQEGNPFDDPETGCVVGCTDTIQVRVTTGKKYVLRAYSWLDPSDLVAKLYWQKL